MIKLHVYSDSILCNWHTPVIFLCIPVQAQAQEMVWEKELLEGLKEKELVNLLDYSHKTKCVAECYRPVRDLTEDNYIKDYLPDTWIALIKVRYIYGRPHS